MYSLYVCTFSRYNFSESTALNLIRDFMQKQYTLHEPATIMLICLYIPVFFLSLLGNGLVIFVVARNAHMRKVKNLFLLNLSLSDLLVTLVCMPMVVGQTVFRLWVYGSTMCKLSVYTQGEYCRGKEQTCCSFLALAIGTTVNRGFHRDEMGVLARLSLSCVRPENPLEPEAKL